MAVGDYFGVFMGTGATNRQPASGVFEEVSAINSDGTTDAIMSYDGSNTIEMNAVDGRGDVGINSEYATANPIYNMSQKIGNGVYLRKNGTTDRMSASGVQVDT